MALTATFGGVAAVPTKETTRAIRPSNTPVSDPR